ncbi:Flp family type IVb pilin [Erythrobacter sp. NE805]|uniref:Flp family type IVb pilin n=1 Tax=Erythrobacter sp. NE805 TaxID=3389875 RepID=UPI00396B376E
MLGQLTSDEAGATAIEYGLIAALIAVAAIIAFQALGLTLAGVFENITNAMQPGTTGA